ncbi:MAG: hypothetical protein VX916_07610 [Planctomycetota bacterium]|nr:hypothetical protein [Planctomycetota bacterium]
MPSYRLFLILIAVALLLIPLLWDGKGDESVSPPALVSGSDRGMEGLPPGLTGVFIDEAEAVDLESLSLELEDVDLNSAALAASEAIGSVTGWVTDRLGHPIPNEHVVLLLEPAPWDPRNDDEDRPLLSHTVTDEKGAFHLAAVPHRQHLLVAGGNVWPRLTVEDVRHEMELRLQLEEAYLLKGTVIDEATGEPIPSASVLGGASSVRYLVMADDAGRFSIGPLPGTDAWVGAWKEGYDVEFDGVSPVLGDVMVELPVAEPFIGRVEDEETGDPISEGTVTMIREVWAYPESELPGVTFLADNQMVHESKTDFLADGSFTFEHGGAAFGTVLHFESPGYVPEEYERWGRRSSSPGKDGPVIRMRPSTPVVGTVTVRETGRMAAGATVTANTAFQVNLQSVTADANGEFLLPIDDYDGEGRLYVTATDEEGRSARSRSRKAGEPVELQLVDPFHAKVLVTRSGEPVAGAGVIAFSKGVFPTELVTDADGTAPLLHSIEGEETERVSVVAWEGFDRSLLEVVELSEWDNHSHEPLLLELGGGVYLAGLVTDPFGVSIPMVEIRVSRGPSTFTDTEGRFHLGPFEEEQVLELRLEAEGFLDRKETVIAEQSEVYLTMQPVIEWTGIVVNTATGQGREDWSGRLEREIIKDGETSYRSGNRPRVRQVREVLGEFAVGLSEPGRYRLRFSSRDAISAQSDWVDFDGINPPPYTTVLMSSAAVLEVLVTDFLGQPIPGFEVRALDPEVLQGLPAGKFAWMEFEFHTLHSIGRRTDNEGIARFNLGEGGRYRIALGDELADAGPISVYPGVVVERQYYLPATGAVEVTVRDEEGKVPDYIRLSVRTEPGAFLEVRRDRRIRGGDGTVTVDLLPPTTYTLRLSGRDYTTMQKKVTVREGLTARETLTVHLITEEEKEKAKQLESGPGSKGP